MGGGSLSVTNRPKIGRIWEIKNFLLACSWLKYLYHSAMSKDELDLIPNHEKAEQ